MGLAAQANPTQDIGMTFFKGTWSEALEESQKTGKPIFVDAYTTWCGPCKWMNKNTFTDEAVGEFYNENFINVKLNMETPDGRKFSSKYRITAYPTLLYLDSEGKVKHRIMGAKPAEMFLDHGQMALEKLEG